MKTATVSMMQTQLLVNGLQQVLCNSAKNWWTRSPSPMTSEVTVAMCMQSSTVVGKALHMDTAFSQLPGMALPVYGGVPDAKRQREYFLVKKHTGYVIALCTILSTETDKGSSHSVNRNGEGASEGKCYK